MKTKSLKRKLYRRETNITENDEEVRQMFEHLSGDLDRYIQESESKASAVLRDAGYDPSTLFDVVENERGGTFVRYSEIDTDLLSPEADSALRILVACSDARGDLDSVDRKNALWRGISLAQSVDHLNANLAWWKSVSARKTSNRNLQHDVGVSDDDIEHVLRNYRTRQEQADKLGITVRQIQRRLKKIASKKK